LLEKDDLGRIDTLSLEEVIKLSRIGKGFCPLYLLLQPKISDFIA
jgi:hypothetical protein